MKDTEKYAKELAGIPFSELAMTKDGKICRCKEILCRDCAFYERKFPFCREAERIESVVHTEIARLTAEVARLTAENAELRERLKEAEPRAAVAERALSWLCGETMRDIRIIMYPNIGKQVRDKQELYDYCIEQGEKEPAEEEE